MKKECVFCGNSFTTLNPNRKYDKATCRKQMSRQRHLPLKTVKVCPSCKKEFMPYQRDGVYCSRKCYNKCYYKTYRLTHVNGKEIKRWQILNRDNFTCQYCGRNPTQHNVVLHIDHIKPKADGGTDDLNNLVTACDRCNFFKSSCPLRNEADFKKRLGLSKDEQKRPKFKNELSFDV